MFLLSVYYSRALYLRFLGESANNKGHLTGLMRRPRKQRKARSDQTKPNFRPTMAKLMIALNQNSQHAVFTSERANLRILGAWSDLNLTALCLLRPACFLPVSCSPKMNKNFRNTGFSGGILWKETSPPILSIQYEIPNFSGFSPHYCIRPRAKASK